MALPTPQVDVGNEKCVAMKPPGWAGWKLTLGTLDSSNPSDGTDGDVGVRWQCGPANAGPTTPRYLPFNCGIDPLEARDLNLEVCGWVGGGVGTAARSRDREGVWGSGLGRTGPGPQIAGMPSSGGASSRCPDPVAWPWSTGYLSSPPHPLAPPSDSPWPGPQLL